MAKRNPDVKRGKLNKWVTGAAFRVRRSGGRLLVDIKRRAPNPRSRIRVGPLKKRKVAKRVGAALKGFFRGRGNAYGLPPRGRLGARHGRASIRVLPKKDRIYGKYAVYHDGAQYGVYQTKAEARKAATALSSYES